MAKAEARLAYFGRIKNATKTDSATVAGVSL